MNFQSLKLRELAAFFACLVLGIAGLLPLFDENGEATFFGGTVAGESGTREGVSILSLVNGSSNVQIGTVGKIF